MNDPTNADIFILDRDQINHQITRMKGPVHRRQIT